MSAPKNEAPERIWVDLRGSQNGWGFFWRTFDGEPKPGEAEYTLASTDDQQWQSEAALWQEKAAAAAAEAAYWRKLAEQAVGATAKTVELLPPQPIHVHFPANPDQLPGCEDA